MFWGARSVSICVQYKKVGCARVRGVQVGVCLCSVHVYVCLFVRRRVYSM